MVTDHRKNVPLFSFFLEL